MSNLNENLNKQDFIKKLELLRDLEAEKKVEEIDVSLIKACVELILELRGENIKLTPEEVEEKVRKIPFVDTASLNTTQSVKSRATKNKSRKLLLIAAIISILVAILAVSSIAFEWNVFDELKNRFGTVADAPVNQEIDVGGLTIIIGGDSFTYKNSDEFLGKCKINILNPNEFPDGIVLNKIIVSKCKDKDEYIFVFNNPNFMYSILFDTTLSDEIKTDAEKLTVNGLDCYMYEMKDVGVIQVNFEHNGNLYEISYNNKQDLIDVIENLKELK
ncbi:MAG: hypothetical protein IKC01_05180 [Clostridia bacterium]|nr:hypothetical protein [Clostridia bacterium]